jgi:cupin 2 domain-containing protein
LSWRADSFKLRTRFNDWLPLAVKDRVVPRSGNLFDDVSRSVAQEQVSTLAASAGVRIERIVSTGQASPPGFWYDQDRTEWVFLIAGSAGVLIEGETPPRVLHPGDYLELPAHVRHRVEWTDSGEPTIWLAVHVGDG